ncbi:MAG: hypothetical protein D6706_14845, partial [Chloroflexi bacterium]
EVIRLVESDLGKVQMSGTALLLLDEQENGRRALIVLAASNQGLENTVNRLLELIPLNASYALADCLLQDELALCPTNIPDEEVEAELKSGGTPAEETEEETETDGGADISDLNATLQGSISLGETVEAVLAPEESHAWTFSDGPALIDITVEGGDDLDAILEIYDPDNQLLTSSDSSFSGGVEQLLGVDIPDDQTYTIVVRDFFNDGGDYTLTVSESTGVGEAGTQVFVFVDDDGVPLSSGFTSVDEILGLLPENFDVTVWTASVDGPLQEGMLLDYDLVIWDSGDYQNAEGFFDEDTAVILSYLDAGGDIFITGSAPTLFGDADLAPISDLEVAGEDPVLISGLNVGDIIQLDQTYDAILTDLLGEDTEENSTGFFLRGPASEGSGNVAGISFIEQVPSGEQRSIILMVPFAALPADIQTIMMNNFLTWFGLISG